MSVYWQVLFSKQQKADNTEVYSVFIASEFNSKDGSWLTHLTAFYNKPIGFVDEG